MRPHACRLACPNTVPLPLTVVSRERDTLLYLCLLWSHHITSFGHVFAADLSLST